MKIQVKHNPGIIAVLCARTIKQVPNYESFNYYHALGFGVLLGKQTVVIKESSFLMLGASFNWWGWCE